MIVIQNQSPGESGSNSLPSESGSQSSSISISESQSQTPPPEELSRRARYVRIRAQNGSGGNGPIGQYTFPMTPIPKPKPHPFDVVRAGGSNTYSKEIEVFSYKENIAINKKSYLQNQYGGALKEWSSKGNDGIFLTDGEKNVIGSSYTIANNKEWLVIDLGSVNTIEKIKFYNYYFQGFALIAMIAESNPEDESSWKQFGKVVPRSGNNSKIDEVSFNFEDTPKN